MERVMRRFLSFMLFTIVISNSFLFGHGFGPNTLVKSASRGFYSIRTICELYTDKKFQISSYDFKINNHRSHRVISAGISKTNCHMKLGFEKGSDISCTPSQVFYLADQQKWINACQLKIGDLLLGKNNTVIPITHIEFIKKPLTVYSIEVKKAHTYFVGSQSILTHNMIFPLALTAGLSVAFGSGAAVGGSAGSFFGPITLVGGIVIGGLIGLGVHCIWGARIQKYRLNYDIAVLEGEIYSGSMPIYEGDAVQVKPIVFSTSSGGQPQSRRKRNNKQNSSRKEPNKDPNDKEKIKNAVISSATAAQQYYDELEEYFQELCHKSQDVVQHIYDKTGIWVQNMNFRHLFEAVGRRGQISGYHSAKLFPQHLVRIIKKFPLRIDAEIRALNGVGRELIEEKTLFPEAWDGFKIAEQFFEIFKNIKEVDLYQSGSGWITSEPINGQEFSAFIHISGKISTFFPKGPQ